MVHLQMILEKLFANIYTFSLSSLFVGLRMGSSICLKHCAGLLSVAVLESLEQGTAILCGTCLLWLPSDRVDTCHDDEATHLHRTACDL